MSDELQTIFTTGDVARICHVGQRTAQRWCDLEYLPSHRILGGNRRIKREHLIRFMKEHGMPLGELEDEWRSP